MIFFIVIPIICDEARIRSQFDPRRRGEVHHTSTTMWIRQDKYYVLAILEEKPSPCYGTVGI